VTESTFALPVYRWPAEAEVAGRMVRWAEQCLRDGLRPVFQCYSLGKAQRVLAALPSLAPWQVHRAALPYVDIYRAAGIGIADVQAIDDRARPTIAPPGTPLRGRFRTAAVSGWAATRGQGFILSDHADWPGLERIVDESGAQEVWFTHGFAAQAARWYAARGLRTRSIR